MRTVLRSVASFAFTFAGVIVLLWALIVPERFLAGIVGALVLFAVGMAFYRRATGRTAFDARGAVHRLATRAWATWAGGVLVFVGLVVGGFDPSITPALVTWFLSGVLVGFGTDEPRRGRLVALLPLAVPSAAVLLMAVLMVNDAATDAATRARWSAGELAQTLAAFWLVLVGTAGLGCVVGIGIHRLLLRLAAMHRPAPPPAPSGSRP